MHAYFPALNSYPSLLGVYYHYVYIRCYFVFIQDMLANGLNQLGFTWVCKKSFLFSHMFH
jgi:hypothetical protein